MATSNLSVFVLTDAEKEFLILQMEHVEYFKGKSLR
jgi:hypothetical protein